MGLSISAEQKSIQQVFSGKEIYIIPAYQRTYSWDIEQCTELWDDILFSLKRDKQDGYFLGNIVIAQSKSKKDILEVIDGQQRLITLTLFLRALSFFDKDNNDIDDALWVKDRRDQGKKKQRVNSYVFENNDKGELSQCLSIEVKDIQNISSDKKKRNKFEENLYFFYIKLKKYIDEENDKAAREFSNYLLDNVYILPILSVDQDENMAREKALTIFETINNRGLELSDADIFKSQLYNSSLNNLESEIFIERWDNIIEACDKLELTLSYIFRIYSHVIRGQNGEDSTEIGLRQFFNLDKNSLKKKNYRDVLSDIEKIIDIVQFTFQSSKKLTNANQLCKWLQIIFEYNSQFPKFAIYVYLFNHYEIIKKPIEDTDPFIDFLQNLVRCCYFIGLNQTIKFEIFKIIVKVSKKEKYEYYPSNISGTHFENLGRFKNAFTLLSAYLDKSVIPIYPYYFDKIINSEHIESLNTSWKDNQPLSLLDSLGNLVLSDLRKKRISLSDKGAYFSKSQLKELQEISRKVDNWTYSDYEQRNEIIVNRLTEFFKGNR